MRGTDKGLEHLTFPVCPVPRRVLGRKCRNNVLRSRILTMEVPDYGRIPGLFVLKCLHIHLIDILDTGNYVG